MSEPMSKATAMRYARSIAAVFGFDVYWDSSLHSYLVTIPEVYSVEGREDPNHASHMGATPWCVLAIAIEYAWDLACYQAEIASEESLEASSVANKQALLDAALDQTSGNNPIACVQLLDMAKDEDYRVTGESPMSFTRAFSRSAFRRLREIVQSRMKGVSRGRS